MTCWTQLANLKLRTKFPYKAIWCNSSWIGASQGMQYWNYQRIKRMIWNNVFVSYCQYKKHANDRTNTDSGTIPKPTLTRLFRQSKNVLKHTLNSWNFIFTYPNMRKNWQKFATNRINVSICLNRSIQNCEDDFTCWGWSYGQLRYFVRLARLLCCGRLVGRWRFCQRWAHLQRIRVCSLQLAWDPATVLAIRGVCMSTFRRARGGKKKEESLKA